MNNFKMVILDYPKLSLANPLTQKVFSDTICSKQENFKRASELYVSMNAQDMISTHFLIYDTSNIFNPKQVLAIRICYENRARMHKLNLPVEDYIDYAPVEYKEKYESFKKKAGIVVDCNAHYVDENYTFSKTGLNLSEIAYYSLVMFILRKGLTNWVGATNEKFKASRWASKTGYFEEGLIFTHPKVEDPHKLILIDRFNYDWLVECGEKYSSLVGNALEITPAIEGESLMSYEDGLKFIYQKSISKNLSA